MLFKSQLEKSSKANNEGTTPRKLQTKGSDSTCNISWNNCCCCSISFPDKKSTADFLKLFSKWWVISNPKPHIIQTIASEMQQLIVIRSCRFYELWLNGFKHGKQREFPNAKILLWQHNLVQRLSESSLSCISYWRFSWRWRIWFCINTKISKRSSRKAISANEWWKVFSGTARCNFIW